MNPHIQALSNVLASLDAQLSRAGISMEMANEDFRAHHAALTAAIALMRGQSWQSVDDALPPKHQWVLIYHDGISVGRYWPYEKGVHDDNEWHWEVVGSDWVDNVTHWQPLAAPPKDTADEQ
jgi:hypothetical protein